MKGYCLIQTHLRWAGQCSVCVCVCMCVYVCACHDVCVCMHAYMCRDENNFLKAPGLQTICSAIIGFWSDTTNYSTKITSICSDICPETKPLVGYLVLLVDKCQMAGCYFHPWCACMQLVFISPSTSH
jgi:hypothetical protein